MQNIFFLLLFLVLAACSSSSDKSTDKSSLTVDNKTITTIADSNSQKQSTNFLVEQKKDSIVKSDPIKIEEKKVEQVPKKIVPPKPKPKPQPIPPKEEKKLGSLHIFEQVYDFGRVNEGDIVTHDFEIENRGNAPLKITDVEVDCGCTVPEYTKEAIPVGDKATIKITFDTKGKLATQTRYITIYTDGKPLSKLIRLKGIVATD